MEKIELGSSVAEFDQALERYFVETQTFRKLISDQGDIVAGDKGTGKTALYRILKDRYASIPELAKVEVLPAFNPAGNPVFQHLADAPVLEEGQYSTVWKSYLLSLAGNWILGLWQGAYTDSMVELDEMLSALGLRSTDDSAEKIFSKIVAWIRHILNPSSAEVAITFSDSGMPIVAPVVRYERFKPEDPGRPFVSHEKALALLDRVLDDADLSIWIVLDRLDEAFVGHRDIERPALRALLRTYLDLLAYPRIRLKLFLRNDLFRKITDGGFVNLTHVNARRIEVRWDEADLMNLLCRRIRENPDAVSDVAPHANTDQELFSAIFPDQVDTGPQKAKTWSWIMSRIRDGNHVKPPRNLIDLVKMAQDAQLRREERDPRAFPAEEPLIEADSLRKALAALSDQRVQDTLIAEAGEYAPLIERFRSGKAEHNDESLATTLGVVPGEARSTVKPLVEIGFIEPTGNTFKIPMLYRGGLGITQGKAF